VVRVGLNEQIHVAFAGFTQVNLFVDEPMEVDTVAEKPTAEKDEKTEAAKTEVKEEAEKTGRVGFSNVTFCQVCVDG